MVLSAPEGGRWSLLPPLAALASCPPSPLGSCRLGLALDDERVELEQPRERVDVPRRGSTRHLPPSLGGSRPRDESVRPKHPRATPPPSPPVPTVPPPVPRPLPRPSSPAVEPLASGAASGDAFPTVFFEHGRSDTPRLRRSTATRSPGASASSEMRHGAHAPPLLGGAANERHAWRRLRGSSPPGSSKSTTSDGPTSAMALEPPAHAR